MANPVFIHVQDNGDIHASIDPFYTPASGTNLAIFRVSSSVSSQKLGTITATAGAVTAVSGGTGKQGKEIV